MIISFSMYNSKNYYFLYFRGKSYPALIYLKVQELANRAKIFVVPHNASFTINLLVAYSKPPRIF